ncbi:hypothetical protein [Pseudophaeobacter sp.]|uniref:hypothetical protein n=1 Tax=Pseudophaeobacter sp. TaxID=1971739 RepID=UPI00329729C4
MSPQPPGKPKKQKLQETPAPQSPSVGDASSVPPPEAYSGAKAQVPRVAPPQMPPTPTPDAIREGAQAGEAHDPLTEREKYLVNIITRQVLNQIDPLLIKLQQISNESVSLGAQRKLQELEQGINERIEQRILKINALIGRKGR